MYKLTTATKKIASLKKRIRVIQGGSSASKTISILLILIDRAQQSQKEKELTSIVAESIPHLKRGAMRDFKNIMQAHGYWRDEQWNATDSIYTFESGNQIEFFSTDNGDKLRGARRHWLFMNEANNCTFEAYEQLEIRTKLGIYIDYNPTSEFWAHTDLIDKKDDVDFIIVTYKDNEALDEQIVKALESRKIRENWWKVYGLGQLGEVEGRIYTGWQIIDDIPHEARLERYGLDFGYSNDPTAIVAVYYYNGGYIVDEVCYQTGMLNKQIADVLKSVPMAVTIADSAEPKSIDDIRQYGVTVLPANKGKDSIRQGIQLVQWQKISVTKRSVNLIKEYRNYLWAIDKDGKFISPNEPEKGQQDHLLDSLRYAITSIKVPNNADAIAQMRARIHQSRRNILTNQVE